MGATFTFVDLSHMGATYRIVELCMVHGCHVHHCTIVVRIRCLMHMGATLLDAYGSSGALSCMGATHHSMTLGPQHPP
jgi:hypothetical protein